MKIVCTKDSNITKDVQTFFIFLEPSARIEKRKEKCLCQTAMQITCCAGLQHFEFITNIVCLIKYLSFVFYVFRYGEYNIIIK